MNNIDYPNSWKKTKLTKIFRVIKGQSYKSEFYCNEEKGRIFINLKCIQKFGGFNFDGIKFYCGKVDEEKLVKPGELIIANTDLTRKADVVGYPIYVPDFYSNKEIATSMDVSILRPKNNYILQKFFYYLLGSKKIHNIISSISEGSTVLHLNIDLLKKLVIPVPPIIEQKKISEILQSIDNDIQKIQEIISKTKLLKQGLLQQLLTKGIGHTEFKETPLGRTPKEWKIVELKDICHQITDGKHGDCRNQNNSGYYFISVKDMIDSKLDYSKARQIVEDDFIETHRRTQLECGDILIASTGATIGKIAIAEDKIRTSRTTFQKSVAIIKPNKEIVDSKYLAYFLELSNRRIKKSSYGGAQKNLLLRDLRKFKVILPKLSFQKEIVHLFSLIDEKLTIEKKILIRLQLLMKGLMQQLLTGKIRVKI